MIPGETKKCEHGHKCIQDLDPSIQGVFEDACKNKKPFKVTCPKLGTVECPDNETCAQVPYKKADLNIYFCPPAFDPKSKCPSTGCLFVHETMHWALRTDLDFKIEPLERCLGCPPSMGLF